jgi:integrase
MASLTREANGGYRIQLIGTDGVRRSVRLGKVNKKTASDIRLRIEQLHALSVAGLPIDADLAAWLSMLGNVLAGRLAAAGLIPRRDSRTLSDYLAAFADRRRPSAKPGTMSTIQTTTNDLIAFFGESTDLRAVTEERADEFKTHYQTRTPKLAAATVARRLRMVKMFFRDALRWKIIDANPFAGISSPSSASPDRQHYISEDDTDKLLAACNPTWRMIIALARLGGLRCPSEVLSLKWSDVNFETNRITATSPKTEHFEGRGYRVIPIFAVLRPHLEEAFELAEGGAEYVVGGGYRAAANGPNGWQNVNLRTTFLKIIKRAGLTPWPRLFQNLRASRETDLMQIHPIHVVTAWMGNTPAVALKHYLQVLDRDFEAASTPIPQVGGGAGVRGKSGAESGAAVVQKAVQVSIGTNTDESGNASRELDFKGYTVPVFTGPDSSGEQKMTLWGLEPIAKTPCKPVEYDGVGAESGSLRSIIDRWPQLTAGQRETILEVAGLAVRS